MHSVDFILKHKKKHHHSVAQKLKADNKDGSVHESSRELLYKIDNSSIVGRYIVAGRDLEPGELLITERPLAIGPCVSSDTVCLGCYKPVELSKEQYRCASCQWPMCGPECRGLYKFDGHTKHECDLLKSQNIALKLFAGMTSPTIVKNLYELILIVRIMLMKENDPERYDKVLVMECHSEMRKKNDELWKHYQVNVVQRLRDEWHFDQWTEDEIHKICGILDVNCFEIGQNSAKARTLYPSAYLLAHDCSPNTSHTDDPETYSIILRTSRKVEEDVAITLSYAYTLQGTLKRREFMYAGKLFWCSCERCSDPKELGTDCSAIMCNKCVNGSIRSSDPLIQDADWTCDSCLNSRKANEIVKLLDKINNDLESIDVHNIPGLESFMTRYSQILRPNHYLILSAKYSLCQTYGRTDGYLLPTMSLADLKRKEQYCREFLAIIDKLEPGLTRLRGLIMYELHAPIMVISQRLAQTNQITRQQFQNNMKEVKSLLRKSRDILKLEPAGSTEYEMGLAAEDGLRKMI